jgi:glycosyltransferase involved in cell wall biosynthesis
VKIGFDAKRLFNNFTGLGNYSRFVVSALQESFPEIEYLLFTPSLKQTPETHPFQQVPFQVRTPHVRFLTSYWRSVRLGEVARQSGVEIFHGLSNELPLRKPPGMRYVCTVHDLIFLRYPTLYPFFDRAIYTAKLRHVNRVADCVVAISEQTSRDLQERMGVDAGRIRVVYQGCHDSFYQPVAAEQLEAIKKKYQLPANYLLTVGTLEERKNAALALKALAAMKYRVPLVLIGRPTRYQPVLDELVSRYALQRWVHYVKVDYRDLPAIYQQARAFVYPSRFEGFGIPIVEAIASGVPAVTTRGGVFPEAGGPDSWYVDPDNPEELAFTLEEIISDPEKIQMRLEKSKVHIQKFSKAAVARQLMDVYNEFR